MISDLNDCARCGAPADPRVVVLRALDRLLQTPAERRRKGDLAQQAMMLQLADRVAEIERRLDVSPPATTAPRHCSCGCGARIE